jgi:hypothetical protein
MRLVLVCGLLLACAHAQAPVPPGFALSRGAAAEVCLPAGAKDWLDSLRCPSGEPPKYRRVASVGSRTPTAPDDPRLLQQLDVGGELPPGDPDLHIVDAYEATCGNRTTTLFVDGYHCAHRARPPPPPGFSQE